MTEYEMIWRNKWLTTDSETIDEMILKLTSAAEALVRMQKAGVELDLDGSDVQNDYARLVTDDPKVAEEFGLEEAYSLYEDDDEDLETEVSLDDDE